jgi:hypothetical protein
MNTGYIYIMYNSSDLTDNRIYVGSTIDAIRRSHEHLVKNSFLKNRTEAWDWNMKTLPKFKIRTRKDLYVIEFVYIYLCEFFNIHLLNTLKGNNWLSNHEIIDENYETILEGIDAMPFRRPSHFKLAKDLVPRGGINLSHTKYRHVLNDRRRNEYMWILKKYYIRLRNRVI